jgi:hypothetical protein
MEGVGGKGGGEGRGWGGGEGAEAVLVLAQVFGESQGEGCTFAHHPVKLFVHNEAEDDRLRYKEGIFALRARNVRKGSESWGRDTRETERQGVRRRCSRGGARRQVRSQ